MVRPLTPTQRTTSNGILADNAEIVAADHKRDRGQLRELTAAERQRAADQEVIDDQCDANAAAQRRAIEEATKEAVKIKRPFWKGLF